MMRSRRLGAICLGLTFLSLVPMLAPAIAGAQATPIGTPANGLTYDQAKQKLDRVLLQTERVRGQLDRTQFDVAALAANLGLDAEVVAGFVHDQIAFEQYPGLLRGARGTLLARAGNALDQAVLLWTLLDKAGYKARIAHGTLTTEQAQSLVAQMAAPRKPAPPQGNIEAMATLLRQIAQTAGLSDDETEGYVTELESGTQAERPDQLAAAQADAQLVVDELASAGIKLGDPGALDALTEEARDYFWVEYRESGSADWTAIHPAFKTAAAPDGLSASETFETADAIPASLQPRVRIEVTLERNVDGQLETKPLASPIEQPAAAIAWTPITFINVPNGADKATNPQDVSEVIDKTSLFLVSLGDEPAGSSSVVFDLKGGLYNLKELKPGEFGIEPQMGDVVAGSLATAIAALGGDETATPAPEVKSDLTAEWIDYTLVAPGGTERTIRRMVVDRIGADRRQTGATTVADPNDSEAVKAALMGQFTIMVGTGAVPPAFVSGTALGRLTDSGAVLQAELKQAYNPNEPVTVSDDVRSKIGSGWPGLLPLFAAFDPSTPLADSTIAYRPEPAIAVYRDAIVPDSAVPGGWTSTSSIDIVSNGRRAFSVAGGSVAPAPELALLQGVWETHQERAAVGGTVDSFDTMAAFAAAQQAGIALKVIASEEDLAKAGLALPADSLAHLRDDLAAGYAVVVPAALPDGATTTGWWRVEPQSGETLGMTGDGHGQEASEYVFILTSVLCTAAGAALGGGPVSIVIACGFLGGGYLIAAAGGSAMAGLVVSALGTFLGFAAGKAGI